MAGLGWLKDIPNKYNHDLGLKVINYGKFLKKPPRAITLTRFFMKKNINGDVSTNKKASLGTYWNFIEYLYVIPNDCMIK